MIDGHPIAMSPLPVPEHQRVSAEIRFALMTALKQSRCKLCKAYDPLDYKIEDSTIVQPDVLIVCGAITKKYLDFPPVLVVEVLSPSTIIKDKNKKFNLYQDQNIRYYLMADIDKKTVTVFKLVNNEYQNEDYKAGYQFELSPNCLIVPDLENIWEE